MCDINDVISSPHFVVNKVYNKHEAVIILKREASQQLCQGTMKVQPVCFLLLIFTKDPGLARGYSSRVAPWRSYSSATTCLLGRKTRQQDNAWEDNTGTNKPQLNRRDRLEQLIQRDGDNCVWCRTPFQLTAATTDHLIPKLKGGPSWIENEVAACRRCNKQRGHTMPTDWLNICRSRGWDPNETAIVDCLTCLDQAIQQRGGQRRARPHLANQLKKLVGRQQ